VGRLLTDWLSVGVVCAVQEAAVGAGVHRGALPRVVVGRRSGHLSHTSHRRLDRVHDARHHPRTLPVRRQLRLLQQPGQGKFTRLSQFVVDVVVQTANRVQHTNGPT